MVRVVVVGSLALGLVMAACAGRTVVDNGGIIGEGEGEGEGATHDAGVVGEGEGATVGEGEGEGTR